MQKELTIIGYGSQARAWAHNLSDSGWKITIALRTGSTSWQRVDQVKFATVDLDQSSTIETDYVGHLIPDADHGSFLETYKKKFVPGTRFIYAHGYSFIKEEMPKKFPQFGHLLMAPKGIATELRAQYLEKGKLAAAYSLEGSQSPEQDREFLLTLAADMGITAGPYEATFQEEAYADLFSEQTLLCSLLPYGALKCYNKLREKNIPKEIAYFECWYELKLIVDTMVALGPHKFFDLISPNALIGGEKGHQKLFDREYEAKLQTFIDDIWEKKFFNEIDETSVDKVRDKINSFWAAQEITQVHEELKEKLFSGKNSL